IAAARQHINEQITDPLDFDDNIALARLDVRIEALQEERQRYEAVLGKLLPAAEADNKVLATELLAELDDWRDEFDGKTDAGLIDRPELTDAKGSRREMTILFCDMKGFTTFSEGMTPAALVTVLNRYMTVMSEPVRRHNGIIDKYIGDAIMAFWGPPFAGADDQARLACLAAVEQLAALPAFQAELPDLMGLRRGLPQLAIRVGVATGEVVVGNIGSEQTR